MKLFDTNFIIFKTYEIRIKNSLDKYDFTFSGLLLFMILHPKLLFLLKMYKLMEHGWNKTVKNCVSNINHSVDIEHSQK